MNCDEIRRDVSLAAAGVLAGSSLARVRKHVSHCPDCAALMREFERLCSAQASAAKEIEDVPIRVRARPLPRPESIFSGGRFWRWLAPAAGAGLAALLLWSALRSVPDYTKRPEQSAERAPLRKPTLGVSSFASYRSALSDSGEGSLDSMLARDADALLRAPSPRELEQLLH